MMVWQEHQRNEWSVSIQRALEGIADMTDAPRGALDPFSLADPTTTEQVLDGAGFGDATFTDVREPVYYGPDVAAALEWVCGFSSVGDALRGMDTASTARVREHLRLMLVAHAGQDGVWFDSRAWLVTARRR